jgi:hypothetical protein
MLAKKRSEEKENLFPIEALCPLWRVNSMGECNDPQSFRSARSVAIWPGEPDPGKPPIRRPLCGIAVKPVLLSGQFRPCSDSCRGLSVVDVRGARECATRGYLPARKGDDQTDYAVRKHFRPGSGGGDGRLRDNRDPGPSVILAKTSRAGSHGEDPESGRFPPSVARSVAMANARNRKGPRATITQLKSLTRLGIGA